MSNNLNRRDFISRSAAIAIGAAVSNLSQAGDAHAAGPMKKAACIGVLPEEMSVMAKFEVARNAGFAAIEPNTIDTPEEVRQYKKASESTGVRIHSIMNSDHWKYPLTDSDPEVVKKCVDGIKTSMHNAAELGADTVLLVPGIVTPDVGYAQVYRRSQEQIRKLLPLAKELKVIIAVENVGNRFLLSPLEFARYIDEFKSPWLKAYFDIGNLGTNGYPQDWIRTLGKRIVKVHIKKFEPGVDYPKFDPKDRRTQGIAWADVRKAFDGIGYNGWVSAEVRSGDAAYAKEVSARMDRIFAGQNPV